MTEMDGLSMRDELEELMGTLRRLRADADAPGFVEWRASADSTMSKMLGPRHRLTLALRNVSFASDFGQARARALALLTSAASLADTMPDPALATGQPPEITQQPEPKRERGLRRLGRKRDAGATPSDILEQPAPAAPAPDVADLKFETFWPEEPLETEAVPEPEVTPEPRIPEPMVEEEFATADEPGEAPAPPEVAEPPESPEIPEEPETPEAPEIPEPKRKTFFGKRRRKPEPIDSLPAGHEGPEATVDEEVPAEPPAEELVATAVSDVPAVLPDEPAVPPDEPAQLVPDPAPEPLVPPGETMTREPEPSWARPTVARDPEQTWTPPPPIREPETSWEYPSIGREPDIFGSAPSGVSQRPTWGRQGASRSPKRGRRRLAVAALVIVILAVVIGLPVWLMLFDGWSTVSGLWPGNETTTSTSLSVSGVISPSADAVVVDAAGDPRSEYIVGVVRAGIVQLMPNEMGEVSFLPAKVVGRGEFLVWLDRVQRIPAGDGNVADTFYYDLDPRLREIAIDAYQQRIVLEWAGGDAKVAFRAGEPILARDAEAWAARMIVGLLPATDLQSGMGITQADALHLRARISSLEPQELAAIVDEYELRPEAGWARQESITRSEAAEFLMRLKAVFDK